MIDLSINELGRKSAIETVRQKKVTIPTFAQLKNPENLPGNTLSDLSQLDRDAIDPLNLYRITWKNNDDGKFGSVNTIEIPPSISGVSARIIGLIGHTFPTGSHKAGAAFGTLVPKLITGHFQPDLHSAVWPSTGNFCRGGAYISALLGCSSIAVLPEEMSRERFEWLEKIAGEVIKTPGSESNVKEIYDKCAQLSSERDDLMIFNQFEEFGNYLWHHEITGAACNEAAENAVTQSGRVAGFVSSSGSAGTLAAGDFLKKQYPGIFIAASEALQCPTMLYNGFGEHHIEGIGDKHIPWIHNVKNSDVVTAVDDAICLKLLRLFNEEAGQKFMLENSISETTIHQLARLGISGIANILSAIKCATYFELSQNDIILTVFTDSSDLYRSRIEDFNNQSDGYNLTNAAMDYNELHSASTGHLLELRHYDKKRIHNLKYYTWIEQQGKSVDELNAQWYDKDYWTRIAGQVDTIDQHIQKFNQLCE